MITERRISSSIIFTVRYSHLGLKLLERSGRNCSYLLDVKSAGKGARAFEGPWRS